MTINLYDGARMSVSGTPGTGTITLGAAVPPYLSFTQADVPNGAQVTYGIIDGTSGWELGRGIYTSSGTTLTRATILASNNSGAAINASSSAQVFITAAAEDIPSIQGNLFGLQLAAAGGTGTFSITAGAAADSTASVMMQLTSAFSKTTGAWSAGSAQGALDTGSIAVTSWYYVHVIKNITSGISDILFSLSATAPTLPSGYGYFRRIGCMKTDASSHWVQFTQNGDEFLYAAPVQETVGAAIPTTATTPLQDRMVR